MRDINKMIIIPACQKNKKSYALSLNKCGLKTDTFVSHSWDEPFGEFVDCIDQAHHNKLRKPNLWICAFGLLQGTYEEIQAQLGTGDTPLDQSPFVRALRGATNYLVVRNRKTDLCERIWCICEFVYAKEFELIPDKTIVTGPDTFADRNTSCDNAQSYDPNDKEKILSELTNRSSVEEIDQYIREFRAFASSNKTVESEVKKIPVNEAVTISSIACLNQAIIKVKHDIAENNLSKAQQLEVSEMITSLTADALTGEKIDSIKTADRGNGANCEVSQKRMVQTQVKVDSELSAMDIILLQHAEELKMKDDELKKANHGTWREG